jgi:hypothetical protein
VGLYHPIGHRATLSFLAELAGPYQRHERALLGALEALEASRAVWRDARVAYADSRVKDKRLGRRVPAPENLPPGKTGHWYAAAPDLSRRAAVHALKMWEQDPEQASADQEVRDLVRLCVATGGRLTGEQLDAVLNRRARDKTDDVRWPMTLVVSAAGFG